MCLLLGTDTYIYTPLHTETYQEKWGKKSKTLRPEARMSWVWGGGAGARDTEVGEGCEERPVEALRIHENAPVLLVLSLSHVFTPNTRFHWDPSSTILQSVVYNVERSFLVVRKGVSWLLLVSMTLKKQPHFHAPPWLAFWSCFLHVSGTGWKFHFSGVSRKILVRCLSYWLRFSKTIWSFFPPIWWTSFTPSIKIDAMSNQPLLSPKSKPLGHC